MMNPYVCSYHFGGTLVAYNLTLVAYNPLMVASSPSNGLLGMLVVTFLMAAKLVVVATNGSNVIVDSCELTGDKFPLLW